MIYQPMETLLEATDHSRYRLVLLAALRSTEIAEGLPALVENINGEKPTVIALQEIIEGKVELKEIEARRKTKQKK
ncbi:DNA-directed RNA polymerase subunit omega [Candidatus Omnitrophota bacterium]